MSQSYEEWVAQAEKGTSGDMVWGILEDWEKAIRHDLIKLRHERLSPEYEPVELQGLNDEEILENYIRDGAFVTGKRCSQATIQKNQDKYGKLFRKTKESQMNWKDTMLSNEDILKASQVDTIDKDGNYIFTGYLTGRIQVAEAQAEVTWQEAVKHERERIYRLLTGK